MERFELVESEEDRKREIEELVSYIKKTGSIQAWKIKEIMGEQDGDLGIHHTFQPLDAYNEKQLAERFAVRDRLIEEYRALSAEVKEVLAKEAAIWEKLDGVNNEICNIEGHRLSSETYMVYPEVRSVLGPSKPSSHGYLVRRCLVCGKELSASEISYRDCVVKGEGGPSRVLEIDKENK